MQTGPSITYHIDGTGHNKLTIAIFKGNVQVYAEQVSVDLPYKHTITLNEPGTYKIVVMGPDGVSKSYFTLKEIKEVIPESTYSNIFLVGTIVILTIVLLYVLIKHSNIILASKKKE